MFKPWVVVEKNSIQAKAKVELFHLERIQLLEKNTDPQSPNHKYLLRRATEAWLVSQIDLNWRNEIKHYKLKRMPRQSAIELKYNHEISYLQLGFLRWEINQIERAFDFWFAEEYLEWFSGATKCADLFFQWCSARDSDTWSLACILPLVPITTLCLSSSLIQFLFLYFQ